MPPPFERVKFPFWLVWVWLILVTGIMIYSFLYAAEKAEGQDCQNGKCTTNWRASISAPNPAVVRVSCPDKSDPAAIGYGTGTIFERREGWAYILTAAHLFRDTDLKKVSVQVRNAHYAVKINHVNDIWDIAVIAIKDPGITPIKLGDKIPVVGDEIEIGGFGSGTYKYTKGRLTQFVSPGEKLPYEFLEVKATCRIGDSGGPMVNRRGRLVGVICGTAEGRTVGCFLPRIRTILRNLLRPRLACPPPPPSLPPVSPKPPPVIPIVSVIDYDKLADAILKKMGPYVLQIVEDYVEHLIGPPGEDGAPGKDGKDAVIDLDKLVEKINNRIKGKIRVKITPIFVE